eukprot:CAMPEP_0181169244 /NCGR_PEP_ID=MMETSP1096-20121128/708_1 /TAXON_ID=156174 ORGANISM="Chrysochromulina ericina, Strain CCMP281" /NCGR_SAMPLE_ID=MMETSP1096 /ASSEMBLY_ACC=CAM_ASM_000453 /LENGTH=188 /DNA_ID=CAMNT_0023256683 /DNA_START=142 /DNA_END=709 /DNA_ORIENTATION=+
MKHVNVAERRCIVVWFVLRILVLRNRFDGQRFDTELTAAAKLTLHQDLLVELYLGQMSPHAPFRREATHTTFPSHRHTWGPTIFRLAWRQIILLGGDSLADLAKNEVTDLRLPCEVPWEETRKRFPPDLDAPDMRCLEGMSVFVCSSVVGAESGTPLGDLSGGGSIHLLTELSLRQPEKAPPPTEYTC